MRNQHLSNMRKDRQRLCPFDKAVEQVNGSVGNQIASIELKELQRALQKVAAPAREALLLVKAAGYSYDEAAKVGGCHLGTIKARIVGRGSSSVKFWRVTLRGQRRNQSGRHNFPPSRSGKE
jgi:RNA polymerase sigma-70 factor, ECF subfamily